MASWWKRYNCIRANNRTTRNERQLAFLSTNVLKYLYLCATNYPYMSAEKNNPISVRFLNNNYVLVYMKRVLLEHVLNFRKYIIIKSTGEKHPLPHTSTRKYSLVIIENCVTNTFMRTRFSWDTENNGKSPFSLPPCSIRSTDYGWNTMDGWSER